MFPLPLILLVLDSREDRDFLEALYREHYRLMYYQALKIAHTPEAAQDAVSDAILALTKKIDLLRTLPRNKQAAYLVITVKHQALNLLNRKKREDVTWDGNLPETPDAARPEDGIMAQSGVERIKRAILQLPPREKEIMLMRYFREMKDEEIAKELGVRPGTVRVHLTRARDHLSALLQGKEDAP